MKKKVFLDNLPRYRGNNINWKEVSDQHCKVKFIYCDIEGEVEIADYKDTYLYIKYLDKPIFKINRNQFIYCKIGKLLGKYNSDFKIKIGQIFKDHKRNFKIVNREYRKDNRGVNRKWYKYKCNKCNNEDWIIEGNLTKGSGCNACCPSPQKTVLGINTIWDKARWMVDLGVSEEDAKTHTPSSGDKIIVTCPDCGRTKDKPISVNSIYKTHSIACTCSDKISYPNKFAYSLLNQLNEIYKFDYIEHEYSPEWIGKRSYDNYFIHNSKQYILEMDGSFHKENNRISGQTKEESKTIDNYKDKMAREHNIKVIRINCEKSELEFIKQNILNSRLNEIFDLSIIDWLKVEEFALKNIIKEASDLWNVGIHNIKEISEVMKIGRSTIWRYINKATKLGWCNYNSKEQIKKTRKKRPVEIFKNEISLGIFESIKDLSASAIDLFGISLDGSTISKVCKGKIKLYKGYSIRYIAS